tara:strand:- start:2677 stop:3180 length:504 start_codon:yes stop_codon:yes gene_type:complete
MSRERDAYQKIRDNARESVQYAEVYDAAPTSQVRPNYVSAMVWTSVVAAVVCTIFMGLLLYLVNESNIEDRLEKAASHSLYNLEAVIKEQSIEMQKLRAENKKIHDYLLLWTPMDAQRRATERCKIFEKGTWDKGPNILFRSQKLPSYIPNSTNTCQEGNLCLPFLE